MSARRQPSTTSLSKFARGNSPISQNRSLDFCNSFWGFGDGGVDVLFARMRGATRTMEELKVFWKERAVIEEDYAKRLTKLAKATLGRDEIGELRNSLDAVKVETERQAAYHLSLAQQVRTELETPTLAFNTRQLHHKKTHQASIEKEYKNKLIQETYVNKAREKYEQDCLRINSFTAQSQLVQGKDLEKINLKLERTQQTVQTNEREFANYSKALQDTVQKWEQDWKAFCDNCQDLEEHRLEFMKDILWTYANAVSTVCVADDESCEKIRVALEQMEPERDMENFVREYGTGNQIPDPPAFVNYQAADAIPSSAARPTARISQFVRASSREFPIRQNSIPPPEEEPVNAAGIGAGGGSRRNDPYAQEGADSLTRQPTRSAPESSSQVQQVPLTNGNAYHQGQSSSPSNSAPTSQAARRQSSMASPQQQQQQLQRVLQDPHADPIDPTAETYIKVGSNAYKVDLSKDPQQTASVTSSRYAATPPTKPTTQNGPVDPLMKQLEDLQNAVSTSGSVRRNTVIRPRAGTTPDPKPTHVSSTSTSSRPGTNGSSGLSLSIPGGGAASASASSSQNRTPSPVRDYRNSAEIVVGAHPSVSRPPSPAPPTAAFMVPKSNAPSGAEVVQEVLADYHQSLPGERKSISRSNSVNRGHGPSPSQASIHAPGQQNTGGSAQGQNLARPPSQLGHAGIGAHGSRSNSPQPISRSPSPAPSHVPSHAPSQSRSSFIQPPAQAGQALTRSPSPNTVGIALDPSGRVLHDDMAQRYQQQQPKFQQQPPQSQPPPQQQQQQRPPQTQQPTYQPPPPPVQQIPQQQPQRRNSYVPPVTQPTMMAPPAAAPSYGVTPPPVMYQQTPSPQPGYIQSPPFNPSPVQYQQPVQQQQQQQPRYTPQQSVQQQPVQMGYGSVNSMNGMQSAATYYGNQTPPQQQQIQPVQQQQQQQPQLMSVPIAPLQQQQQQRGYQQVQQQPQQQQFMYRDPSPAARPIARSPSPQPPQAMDDPNPVQFYVKALYDYTATIDEEFDFQAGDIIAVTATPEDGWWSGELLDENRRQKGRNVFPSNFVCLF